MEERITTTTTPRTTFCPHNRYSHGRVITTTVDNYRPFSLWLRSTGTRRAALPLDCPLHSDRTWITMPVQPLTTLHLCNNIKAKISDWPRRIELRLSHSLGPQLGGKRPVWLCLTMPCSLQPLAWTAHVPQARFRNPVLSGLHETLGPRLVCSDTIMD